MYLKWPKRECYILRLELLIMQVQKYGRTSPMITRVTYGHLVAFSMK